MMQKKGLGLLLAAAAAYGYYRYNKMTPEERNALVEKGKKIFNENLGPLGDMFKTKNGSTPNSANTTM